MSRSSSKSAAGLLNKNFRVFRCEADSQYHKSQLAVEKLRKMDQLDSIIDHKIENSYSEAIALIEEASRKNDKSENTLHKIGCAIYRPWVIASYERFYILKRKNDTMPHR